MVINEEELNEAAAVALKYYRWGRFAEALTICEEAQAIGLDNMEITEVCSNALIALRRFDEAESYTERQLEIYVDSPNLNANLAELRSRRGKPEEALAICKHARQRGVWSAKLATAEAGLLCSQMRFKEACDFLKKEREAFTNDIALHYMQGFAHTGTWKKWKSKKVFRRFVTMCEGLETRGKEDWKTAALHSRALNWLALNRMQQKEKAISFTKKKLQEYPEVDSFYRDLATLKLRENPGEAISILSIARQKGLWSEKLATTAILPLRRSGGSNEVREFLEKELKSFPESAALHYILGMEHLKVFQMQSSREEFKKASTINMPFVKGANRRLRLSWAVFLLKVVAIIIFATFLIFLITSI